MGIYEDFWNRSQSPSAARHASTNQMVRVQGPDSAEFLQRICSQDLQALGDEKATWGAFLNNKGRLEARAGIARLGEAFYFDTPRESAEKLAALLDRYHFSEDLSIELLAAWSAIDVLGPEALAFLEQAPDTSRPIGKEGLVIACRRMGITWGRCFGSESALASLPGLLELPLLGDEIAEAHRILRAELRMGVDANERTLAMEAQLEDHISTSKGCYTGQEIVARIHTYGHVNRKLSLLILDSAEVCSPDTSLHEIEGGQPVGRVTSSVPLAESAESLALGYLAEAFLNPGTELRLGGPEGAPVRVCAFSEG